MKNIYLYEYLLPTQMLTKNNEKENNLDYVAYLNAFLNNSLFFYKKFNGAKLEKQASEDCDSLAQDYKLNFEILATDEMKVPKTDSQDKLENKKLKVLLTKIVGRDILAPKRRINLSLFHKITRNYDFEENNYDSFFNEPFERYRKDMDKFKKILQTKNNLMLFYPYTTYLQSDVNCFQSSLENIKNLFERDFAHILSFRDKNCGDAETFISLIYGDFFVVLKNKFGCLSVVDYINIETNKLFKLMYSRFS